MRRDTACGPSSATTGHDGVAAVITKFLRSLKFVSTKISPTNGALLEAMREEAHERNMWCAPLEETMHMAASLIELGYNHLTFEEKRWTVLLTWYLFYVDDVIWGDRRAFDAFGMRFLRGLPQLDPVLDALADVLRSVHDYYDPLIADLIFSSVFNFTPGNCLEQEARSFKLSPNLKKFPWFVRDLGSAGMAYVHMLFPKSTGIRIDQYVQAVPEMTFWLDAVNDILSFLKEELDGETATYVHHRAIVEEKTLLDAVVDIEREVTVCGDIIHTALHTDIDVIRIWRSFEVGYVWYHLQGKRYNIDVSRLLPHPDEE